MQTLRIDPRYPQKRQIHQVVESLRASGVIVYPTDTTYGLGADLLNKKGVDRIYMLKPHKKKKSLSFICSDLKEVSRYARVPDEAYRIMRRLLPGPFTFILEATSEVPKLVMTKRKTVGIRVPDNLICQEILRELGNPIISTSATTQGREYKDDPDEIRANIGHAVDIVIDAGILPFEPSTIVDFTGDEPVLVRQGRGDVSMYL